METKMLIRGEKNRRSILKEQMTGYYESHEEEDHDILIFRSFDVAKSNIIMAWAVLDIQYGAERVVISDDCMWVAFYGAKAKII